MLIQRSEKKMHFCLKTVLPKWFFDLVLYVLARDITTVREKEISPVSRHWMQKVVKDNQQKVISC